MLNQNSLIVEDLEGRVLNAIKEVGCDVVVFANYGQVVPVPQAVTSGHWDDITYDSLTDTTTFTDMGQAYPPAAIDYWLQPDASKSVYLDIVNIGVGNVIVAGNATNLGHGTYIEPGPPPQFFIGNFYAIVWPVGVDPGSGALAHDDPCNPVSRVLFAGYYYMPPVAGTLVAPPEPPSEAAYQQPTWQLASSKYRPMTGPGIQLTATAPFGTIYGQQPGPNRRGDYYCWNRIYDPNIGRWTSPDPAMSPWGNMWDYVASNPINRSDPSGLFGGLFSKWAEHRNLTRRALKLTNVPTCLREQVMKGSQLIDWTHKDVRAFHVDDTRMLGDTEAWLKAAKAAGEHIRKQNGKASCECLASLARIAGMGAHTIQDFYHHTDWFFGAGGDTRSANNELVGLVRWNETAAGARSVRTGSGWVFYGGYEGQRRAEARTGDWHHDPWGSGGPQPPMGYDKAGYLQKVIADVIVPHSGSFLQEAVGNLDVGCCCPEGELKASPGTLTDSSHLTECFGNAAKDLIKYLATRHTSNTQLEK